jgi:hypothetical protein
MLSPLYGSLGPLGRKYGGITGPFGGHATLANNLVSAWKLDESSDGSAPVVRVDAHGSNDLTDNNTVASALKGAGAPANMPANVASFVGANSEYLSVADNASLDAMSGAGGMSVALWLGDYVASSPAGKDTGVANREWVLYANGNIYVFQTDAISQLAGSSFTAGWHLFVFGWDPGDGKVFISKDGAAKTLSAGTLTGMQNTSTQLNIGAYGGGTDPVTAKISSVLVASRAWNAGEITDLWAGGAGLFY